MSRERQYTIKVEMTVWDEKYKSYGIVSVMVPLGAEHHNLGLMRTAVGEIAEALVTPLRNQVEDTVEAQLAAERATIDAAQKQEEVPA